jgi:hypothetical protein
MNTPRHGLAIALLAFATVLSSAAFAAEEKKAASATGTWKWTTQTQDGQSRTTTLKLKQDGEKLTGALARRDGTETAIDDAKIKDGQLSFAVTMEFNGNKFTRKFSGKLDGDTIKGKIESERDGQTQSRDWEAKREAAGAATGTWKWQRTFNNNTMDFVLKLKQDGEKLAGTMAVAENPETAIDDGKVAGADISFSITQEFNGNKMTRKYTGKLDGDTIKGKTEFERDGQTQSRDWEATRAK